MGRIDIHVEAPCVDYEKLASKRNVENAKTIRARVQAARERRLERFVGTKLADDRRPGGQRDDHSQSRGGGGAV